MSDVYEFLRDCGSFWVSTVNGSLPAMRPFGAAMEYKGYLYISSGRGKAVYEQLKQNPAIQIAALKHGTRTWVRISGRAVEDSDPDARWNMFQDCPALWKRHSGPEAPSFVLFRLEDVEALLCTDEGKTPMEVPRRTEQ